MGKRKINKSNVTMEIGEETFPDRCTVVASYDLYMPGTKLRNIIVGVKVLLPSGTIVQNARSAEKHARIEAAGLLDELASSLRLEAEI